MDDSTSYQKLRKYTLDIAYKLTAVKATTFLKIVLKNLGIL